MAHQINETSLESIPSYNNNYFITTTINSYNNLPTPVSFTSLSYNKENELTSFGDLPTPADRSESVSSIFNSQNIGIDSIFSGWDLGEKYQIERIIGRGSYGEVVQAIDMRNEMYVAIKRIRNIFESTIDAKRIYREMFILRHMKHPNIIRLLDVQAPALTPSSQIRKTSSPESLGTNSDGPTARKRSRTRERERESDKSLDDLYLVFEYVDTDLHKLLLSAQYLSTEHIQSFLFQLLSGLKYIHSANVIHRDIKPANILLYEDCTLKICDFGLARIVIPSEHPNATVLSPPEVKSSGQRGRKRPELDSDESDDVVYSSGERDFSPERSALPGEDGGPELSQNNKTNYVSDVPEGVSRQLTHHVVTRWYRAPELILLCDYSKSVDVWSTGCVLAELLGMQAESIPDYQNRSPLFPGTSCPSLSRDASDPRTIGEQQRFERETRSDRYDQLNTILDVIGTPLDEDINEIGNETTESFLRSLPHRQRQNLSQLYKGAHPAAIDLLSKMLEFNPRKRITVDEALNHEFLEKYRNSSQELSEDLYNSSDGNLNMEIEKMPLLVSDDIRANMKREILTYY